MSNFSNRVVDNQTISSQGAELPEELQPASLLHEKQYTPDLKQSDCHLNSSNR